MMLCLDIGNTQVYGGLFRKDQLVLQFRKSSQVAMSSDEIGLFLRGVLRENGFDPENVKSISLCTVVPEALHSVKNACRKYFEITPFVLQAGVKTGLNIRYRNALELGSDRIANAVAATHMYPNENIILVDMGTATSFCAISKEKHFLGGAIIPGIRISMGALETNTSKLPTVEIVPKQSSLGRSTVEGIQAGLYYSTVGAIREIVTRLSQECFDGEPVRVVGTGGFTSLLESEKLFDSEVSDLILRGLYLSYQMNEPVDKKIERKANHADINA